MIGKVDENDVEEELKLNRLEVRGEIKKVRGEIKED